MTMTVTGEDGGDTISLPVCDPIHSENNNEYSSAFLRPSKRMNGGNGILACEDIKANGKTNGHHQYKNGTVGNNHKNFERTPRLLPVKKFEIRESLMTHMLQLEEYQGLYNIFLAVIINITLYHIISESLEQGTIDLGLSHIVSMFGKPTILLPLLIGMHFMTAVPFYGTFRVWADHRSSFYSLESVWDLSFSIALGLFIYGFYYIPFQVNLIERLPPASAAIIVLEQLRLSMKLYSFIREKIPAVLFPPSNSNSRKDSENNNRRLLRDEDQVLNPFSSKTRSERGAEEEETKVRSTTTTTTTTTTTCDTTVNRDLTTKSSDYDKFLYFLYAPTLIYRDSYPRTEKIRWKFVMTNAVELIGCIYFYNLTQHMCGFVQLKNFGLPGHPVTLSQLVRMIFFQMIPGGLSMLLGFFLLLHNTQNIGAELLRFGDRLFYRDWWNSDSFSAYYRKWNLPVHDFLHLYIYQEAREAKLDKIAKPLPAILVFLLSSIFHEYVFIFVLQFFYPVLLIFFGGFGMILAFVPNKGSRSRGNLFIWWSLITGMGLIHSFYILEYYSRVNGCPPAQNPTLDFILPRTWSCSAITFR